MFLDFNRTHRYIHPFSLRNMREKEEEQEYEEEEGEEELTIPAM